MTTTQLVFNQAKKKYSPDDLAGLTVKVLLIETSCTADPDYDDVAALLATGAEFSGTNYTPGASSTDRKTVAVTAAVDDSNNRATATTATASWSAINGGDIKQFLYYIHTGSNDAANIPLMLVYDDGGATLMTTNGSNLDLAASTIRYA